MTKFVGLITAGILLAFLASFSNGRTISTRVAQAAAMEMITNMDPSADPCNDFYQYACGGWFKKNPMPKTRPSWSYFDILDDRLRESIKGILEEKNLATDSIPGKSSRLLYQACMDTGTMERIGLRPLTDFLARFGGWPMTIQNWNEASFDWRVTASSVVKTYSASYLVSVNNDIDSRNTNANIIYVDQGSLVLPREIVLNTKENSKMLSAYTELIIDSAKAVRDYLKSGARDYLKSGATDAQIEKDVQAVLGFETELARITVSNDNRRDNTRMYNPMLVTELQDWTDSVPTKHSKAKINWSKYINDIYSSVNITIPSDERIVVVETQYLKNLVSLLDRTHPRVLANYIHWRMVIDLGLYTTQHMRDLQFDFSKIMAGASEPEKRASTCANEVNLLMGYAVGAKYVERHFQDEAKLEIKEMVINLKKAFKSLLAEDSWMDAATKAIAVDKVDAMNEFLAYPDWIKNRTALEEYYKGISVSALTYFENILNVGKIRNQKDLRSLREKIDRNKWNTFPTVVNALYSPSMNSITFAAGVLQPPFFNMGGLAAMNYGGIGSVIGHEITHGFDDEGRQRDKNGNSVQWWTEETLSKYLVRAQCFIDQYSNFTVASGTHLNGVNTQGENIADNGGLRESFRAYKFHVAANGEEPKVSGLEQFTSEQIFFLSFANNWCGTETPEADELQILSDPHSIFRFRANGPLSNNEDFIREFKCALGTPMNRIDKCILW